MAPPQRPPYEVLARFPLDDSASLLRAALVCKRRARVVADPGLRARFRGFHGGDPTLGFLSDLRGHAEDAISRFVPTSSSRPRRASDARHGRVLLCPLRSSVALSWTTPRPRPRGWSAALLCFVVVGTDEGGLFSCLFSSEDGAWSVAASSEHPGFLESVPGVLVGNALHFLLPDSVRYDLSSRAPACAYYQGRALLMSMEDASLSARELGANGEAVWAQSRATDAEPVLPAQSPKEPLARPLAGFSMDSVIDDVVEEILLRLPRDDPATLVRAGAVCKRWSRIMSAPGFRRSFAQPALIGFLANLRDGDSGGDTDFVARFVPTTSDDPSSPPGTDHRARRALDARHGRVLLASTTASGGLRLEVWDPATGVLRELPPPPRTLQDSVLEDPFGWNAAVIGGTHGTPDNLHCHPPAPFRVLLLDADGKDLRLHIYTSEDDAWSQAKYGPRSPLLGVETVPPALHKSKVYFLMDANSKIMEYDLHSEDTKVHALPHDHYNQFTVLTTTKKSGLGVARICGSKIQLWSMVKDPEDVRWEQAHTLDLVKLLPSEAFPISQVYLGFAHGVEKFLVGSHDGQSSFLVDLSPAMARKKKCGQGHTHGVVPCTSFYIPALRAGTTDEELWDSASSA